MNNNLRTAALIAAGIVSSASVAMAEEARMSPVETALTSTSISGYVSTSALFNLADNDGGVRLPGRSFDTASKINQINLDVVKLTVERPLTEGDWSAGYKVDMLFGPDANVYATSSILGANTSDFGIKQAYVALQTPVGNDLIAKIGVWDSPLGYEVFDSGSNPNYSRSYAYYIEPTAMTGLLLSYNVAKWLNISGGIADAWNSRINAPGYDSGQPKDFGLQAYVGSASITVPEDAGFLKGLTVYGGVVYGLGSQELNDADPRMSVYGGATIPTPLEGLAVGLAYDHRDTEGYSGAGLPAVETTADVYGGYLTYQVSKQVKLSARVEYANGSAGTWIPAGMGTGIDREELFGVTGTLDYNLWENVLTRIEFRWDQDMSDSGTPAFGSANDPNENAYILGLNILYKF